MLKFINTGITKHLIFLAGIVIIATGCYCKIASGKHDVVIHMDKELEECSNKTDSLNTIDVFFEL